MTISRPRNALATLGLTACALVAFALHSVATSTPSGFSWATSSPALAPAPVSPSLARLARSHPGRLVEVIVQLRGPAGAAREAVLASGGRIEQPLRLIDGFAARLPAGAAAGLATIPNVQAITLNASVQGLSQSLIDTSNLVTSYDESVHARRAWAQGATGAGVGVAVIDTGIDGNLPDFQVSQSNTNSRVVATAVVNPAAPNATDTYGHGTHVAGIIAGNSLNRPLLDPAYGKYIGVAPDANLIAIKADDGHGHATVLDLIDGLQFAVDHQAQFNIRVINLSVRSTVAQSYKIDPLDAAVEQAWMHGMVVVAAAGNLGTASDAVSYAPANDPYVITVGAVDDMGTPGTGDDQVPSWSSRGVTQDGFAKPDVLAPGAHIVSTLAPSSDFASLCSYCITPDGNYFKAGGTSMAAAVVSGAVADILSVDPSWTPAQVKAALIQDGRPVPDADTGAPDASPEIDLNNTLQAAGGTPPPPADQGLTPNQFIDPATGSINDQTGSWATGSWGTGSWGTGSWGTGSWAAAPTAWVAPWDPSTSYTGAPLDPSGFSPVPPDCIQLQRGYFSTGSWATGSWSSDQLNGALSQCAAAATATGSWGTGSWGTGSWGTGSWGTGSWGTGSWGTGSWGTGSWNTGSWATGSWGTDFNK